MQATWFIRILFWYTGLWPEAPPTANPAIISALALVDEW